VEPELRNNPNINEVLTYGHTHFNQKTFPDSMLRKKSYLLGVRPSTTFLATGIRRLKPLPNNPGYKNWSLLMWKYYFKEWYNLMGQVIIIILFLTYTKNT
jgi:hypothetical protein